MFITCCQSCTNKKDVCFKFSEKIHSGLSDSLIVNFATSTLSLDSFCIDAYIARGDVYFLADSTIDFALEDYNKVILIDSTNKYAFFKSGMCYLKESNFNNAITRFKKTLSLKSIGKNQGIVDYNNEFALESDNGIKYDVKAVDVFFQLGIAQFYENDFKSTIDNISFCISQKYDLPKSYLIRALAYLQIGAVKDACKDLKTAQFLGNEDANIYVDKHCQ